MSIPDQTVAALLPGVRLSREILNGFKSEIQKIESSAGRVPPEAMGVLLGRADAALVELEEFKPLESGELKGVDLGESFEEFISKTRLKPPGQFSPIGWYAIRFAGEPGLLERDIEFHNRYFRGPFDVALLLRPDPTSLNLGLYTAKPNTAISMQEHRRGSIRLQKATPLSGAIDVPLVDSTNDKLYLNVYEAANSLDREEDRTKRSGPLSAFALASRFGLNRTEGGESEPPAKPIDREVPDNRAKPSAPREAVSTGPVLTRSRVSAQGAVNASSMQAQPQSGGNPPPQVFFPPPSTPAGSSSGKTDLFRVAVWVLGTIIVSVATYIGAHLYLKPELLKLAAQARTETASDTHQTESPRSTLDLRVSQNGTALELQWDRLSPIIQPAMSGTLTVTDGGLTRQIYLSGEQLRTGHIVYTPSLGDVTFRLEVRDSVSHTVAESISVLGSSYPGILHQPSGKATRRRQQSAVTRSLGSRDLPIAGSPMPSLQLTPPQGERTGPSTSRR
jgi:hypothetical protein